VLAASYPFLDIVWTMLIFFAWLMFFWLVIVLFADIFRRDDLSGWAKAGWTFLLFFVPWIGALAYVIARPKMTEQDRQLVEEQQRVAAAVSHSGAVDQLAKLNDLRADGAISQDEYDDLKRKTLTTA
jgi:Short C-terminal domain/Phospholipase_D-nuclease N-terminal